MQRKYNKKESAPRKVHKKKDQAPSVALYFYSLSGCGGAERMICKLAGALVKRGFDVRMVSWDKSGARSFYPIESKVTWSQLGFDLSAIKKMRRVWRLYHFFKFNRIKLLIGFVMSADKTVYAAAKLAGVKIIVAERNAPSMFMIRYNFFQCWIIFRLLGLADRITVQLDSFVKDYPKNLHERIHSIANPVSSVTPYLHAHPEQEIAGRYTLLTVARLDSVQKRIALLINAFAMIAPSFPNWDLLIVGDGPDYSKISRLVQSHSLVNRIRLKTSVTEISDIYTQSHLFVIPSRWEGFSNALAEAMAHGLPAIGFAEAAGVAELIDDGGWLVPGIDDERLLAATLAQAMADPYGRVSRGIIAAQNMAKFEPEEQYGKWEDLLRSVITSSKTKRV
jgi:GalNAc-alpha-(1->4)-GalNAc-alpha-(1->3)-diNAcBac-PP-undecaprenol alpha-1,4-N-acetyl-D-galactosaminyltransferase